MLTGIDHLVILVRNLEEGVEAYQQLGFTVTPGGEHPALGTHNALIPFADGSYIEIIAFKEPDRPHEMRWWKHLAAGGGLVDFAVASDDLTADVAAAAARGLSFNPVDGHRRRLDGQELVWRMAPPAPGNPSPMPFLIQDVTPRPLRVPTGPACEHANSVEGVARVYIAVADLHATGAVYSAILGNAPQQPSHDSLFDADGLSFPCGPARIAVFERSAIANWIPSAQADNSAGIVAAALNVPGQSAGHWLDTHQTLGAMLYLDSG